MTNICYIEKRFSRGSRDIIDKANAIIAEYSQQGYNLTLRQLYYQFVSRDMLANKQSEYKRLGSIINDARLAGLISWRAIHDRTRNLQVWSSFPSIAEALDDTAESFRFNPWLEQDAYIEVWIEKDALVGVIENICSEWRVPYFACRGYNSQSEQWAAGLRLKNRSSSGKEVHILHLGDHDPSGIDMTSDNRDRLSMFAGKPVELHRLALNIDQVRKYNPPPNPAKDTDARFTGYVKQFGPECWELDALEPKVISKIIEKEIIKLVDQERWAETLDREKAAQQQIRDLAEQL